MAQQGGEVGRVGVAAPDFLGMQEDAERHPPVMQGKRKSGETVRDIRQDMRRMALRQQRDADGWGRSVMPWCGTFPEPGDEKPVGLDALRPVGAGADLAPDRLPVGPAGKEFIGRQSVLQAEGFASGAEGAGREDVEIIMQQDRRAGAAASRAAPGGPPQLQPYQRQPHCQARQSRSGFAPVPQPGAYCPGYRCRCAQRQPTGRSVMTGQALPPERQARVQDSGDRQAGGGEFRYCLAQGSPAAGAGQRDGGDRMSGRNGLGGGGRAGKADQIPERNQQGAENLRGLAAPAARPDGMREQLMPDGEAGLAMGFGQHGPECPVISHGAWHPSSAGAARAERAAG
ncbi:hypothetical protein [Falsiroseomonas sp.]|uniref:hypothetical protein n=1 Tax=Falsiroseomonas sp. TaxID=2870721 RepID=UPI00351EB280